MLQQSMNNESNNLPTNNLPSPLSPPSTINQKLSTLLAIIVSIQQKIEILKVKICGYPQFSPQLYFQQIDRNDKGYIDTEDFITFIKKSKPSFNIDQRYLKSLFIKLNQDDTVPFQRLTYFGYLNMIKPYFNNQFAKDILMRDTITTGNQINVIIKKLLEDLISMIYVSVAEHQRIKQLIITGDIEQGGRDSGTFYNIYQILAIIKNGAQPKPTLESRTIPRLPQTKTRIKNSDIISMQPKPKPANLHPKYHSSSYSSQQKSTILDIFYNFINNNSQYQITRQQIKYLLPYLMCHQYMITNQKYLTLLFMPVTTNMQKPHFANLDSANLYRQALNRLNKNASFQPKNGNNIIFNKLAYDKSSSMATELNFLEYIHPNSMQKQQDIKIKVLGPSDKIHKQIMVNKSRSIPPKQFNKKQKQLSYQNNNRLSRFLINDNHSNIHTPMLEQFLRESKILKNMSIYPQSAEERSQLQQSSAFTTGQHHHGIAVEHMQQPVNKDFNFQENSLHRSLLSQNLSAKQSINNRHLYHQYPPAQEENQNQGILNRFLKK